MVGFDWLILDSGESATVACKTRTNPFLSKHDLYVPLEITHLTLGEGYLKIIMCPCFRLLPLAVSIVGCGLLDPRC